MACPRILDYSNYGAKIHLQPQTGLTYDANDWISQCVDESGNGNDFVQPTQSLKPKRALSTFLTWCNGTTAVGIGCSDGHHLRNYALSGLTTGVCAYDIYAVISDEADAVQQGRAFYSFALSEVNPEVRMRLKPTVNPDLWHFDTTPGTPVDMIAPHIPPKLITCHASNGDFRMYKGLTLMDSNASAAASFPTMLAGYVGINAAAFTSSEGLWLWNLLVCRNATKHTDQQRAEIVSWMLQCYNDDPDLTS